MVNIKIYINNFYIVKIFIKIILYYINTYISKQKLLPKKEKAKHKKYSTLMSIERNSEEYRKYLQECKGAKIPYLGI